MLEEREILLNNVINKETVKYNVSSLLLSTKHVNIRFCDYRVYFEINKMFSAETIALSHKGLQFYSPIPYTEGTLMRIWIDIPDYWGKKSRLVPYAHTNAPHHFQILAKIVHVDNIGKRIARLVLTCEIVNIDDVDEKILEEFVGEIL